MPVSTVLTTLILIYIQSVVSIPSCKSDRPGGPPFSGGESHRTLYVSQSSLSDTEEDDKWSNVLCCVYTHVEVKNDKDWDGWLELYDGSWESTSGNTLPEMAQDAYDQICDMGSMGGKDCRTQKSCIDNALNGSTNSPIDKPVNEKTLKPTKKKKKKKKKKNGKNKKKKKKKKNGKNNRNLRRNDGHKNANTVWKKLTIFFGM